MRFKNYSRFLFSIIVFVGSNMYGQVAQQSENNAMVRFTENKNQWDSRVLYKAQLDGGSMYVERNCFTYNFYDKDALLEGHVNSTDRRATQKKVTNHAFRMTFLNALPGTEIKPERASSDFCNYFIGKDEKKWASNVRSYRGLKYISLYSNIHLQIDGLQNSLKYTFIVEPLGNTGDIQMAYEGVDHISLEKGTLKLKTKINSVTEHSPYAYQWIGSKRVEVACEFVLENNTVHFNFPQGYNKGYELVIDPQVVFSASSGSKANNFGHSCTYDADGNLYSGGTAFDDGYPTKMAYDSDFNLGNVDAVVTKYRADGKDIIYSTYLGGWQDEIITSMIVDPANNLYISGVTGSDNFPVTTAAFQKIFAGGLDYIPHAGNGNRFWYGTDIFVCKFSASGNALLGSTFIGGSDNDGINCNNTDLTNEPLDSLQYNYGDYYRGEIDLDRLGDVYVVTATRSKNFPLKSSIDNTLGGLQDAVAFKMKNDLSDLVWSTLLGGSDNDCANGLILDDASNVYITGGTRSKDFPVTAGVVQSLAGGGKADGYVTKIKNDGSTVLASTYWGTDMYDQSYFVQLDKQDNVYLFGQTDGKMPVIGKVYSNPDAKHFITKMNNALSNVVFSTVFGNVDSLPTITPTAFLVDVCSNIYVAGWAGRFNKSNFLENGPAFNLPVTANAPDTSTAGHDFYLMVLRANADSLLYGTYWGGDISAEHCHGGTSRFDRKGIVYQSLCTGCGAQQDYPIYPADAYPGIPGQPNGSNNCNNAIFKIDFQVKLALADFSVDYIKGCAPLTVHFKNQSTSGKFLWDFGSNNTSTDLNPVYTFNNAGTYLVKLFVNDPASCNLWDSVYQYITVYEGITTDFETEAAPCSNEITFKDLTVKNPISWEWDFGDGDKSTLQNPKHTFKEFNKTYPVTLISKSANGCTDTTTVDVDFVGFTTAINADQTVCKGAPVQLKATGGFEYRWVPTAGLSDPTIPDPIATPDTTTIYEVHIKTKNALGDTCESILSTKITVMDPSKISLVATADKDTIVKGETTTIHALTDPSLKIHWTPTTNVNNPTAFNTLVTPPVTTTYTVSINDSLGCSRSATVTIYVVSDECEESNVFVPNTFTPNGDGQNDILYARSNVVSTIYFAVYNRWGQLVFETTDLKKGWDGNYKGMKADPAVFAWYVKGKCFNGKEFFKKGNVTLIR